MAAQPSQTSGNVTSDFNVMSMGQIYDLVSQMKLIVDHDRDLAKEVLVENPFLAKRIFRAQLILDMVKPTREMPNILQAASQSQSANLAQKSSTPNSPSFSVKAEHVEATSSRPPFPSLQQNPIQTSTSHPSNSLLPLSHQPQAFPTNVLQPPQQTKGYMNRQIPSMSLPQASQAHIPSPTHNLQLPSLPEEQFSVPRPKIHMSSSQVQQSLHTPVAPLHPLQPPLFPQPRHTSLPPFPQQLHSNVPDSTGFPHQSGTQQFPSHSMFHSGANAPPFSLGQPPLLSHPPPHRLYRDGLHKGPDYGNQGPFMPHGERGPPWLPPSLMENPPIGGPQFPGERPPLIPWHVGHGHHRPPPLLPEMERAVLEQVMSLTPEQINFLPPEQRMQVIKLQEILR